MTPGIDYGKEGPKTKGSQEWLRVLVNEHKPIFFREILREMPHLNLNCIDQIEWLSPLRKDKYVEYSDSAFIDQLGIKLEHKALDVFWPNRGPVWDGLAKTKTDKTDILLVEAKSHIGELFSILRAKDEDSLSTINQSLTQTHDFLGVTSHLGWTAPFYQYTNRLAHLYFLRDLNKLPAHLIFVYFLNDPDMHGPSTKEEWQGALKLMKTLLGLSRHKLSKYMADIFIDINELQPQPKGKP
jgi:hypothetical protein